jgi:hypothetical protein
VHDPRLILVCLTGLATVAADRGQLQTAAHLWGAAERLQRDMGWTPVLTGTIGHEWLDVARSQLGPAFGAAVTAGARLSPEELDAEAAALLGIERTPGATTRSRPPVSR